MAKPIDINTRREPIPITGNMDLDLDLCKNGAEVDRVINFYVCLNRKQNKRVVILHSIACTLSLIALVLSLWLN